MNYQDKSQNANQEHRSSVQTKQQSEQGNARETYGDKVANTPQCTVERTVNVIGGKWTTLIVRELLGGTKRFGEIRTSLTGVSPKTLTDRLRELEAHGILEREVYAEVPPRVEYSLTERGRALRPIFDAMSEWGGKWT